MDLLTIMRMLVGILAGVMIVGYIVLRMFMGNLFPDLKWGIPL